MVERLRWRREYALGASGAQPIARARRNAIIAHDAHGGNSVVADARMRSDMDFGNGGGNGIQRVGGDDVLWEGGRMALTSFAFIFLCFSLLSFLRASFISSISIEEATSDWSKFDW